MSSLDLHAGRRIRRTDGTHQRQPVGLMVVRIRVQIRARARVRMRMGMGMRVIVVITERAMSESMSLSPSLPQISKPNLRSIISHDQSLNH